MSDETTEGTTTTTEATGTAPAPAVDTDAAALSAARAAMGRAEPDAETAADVVPAAAGSQPVAGDAAALTELQQLRAEIKARENERKARETLEAEYGTKLKSTLETERTKLEAEVRAKLLAEYQHALRTKPADTIRSWGVDGAELVTELARRAGPAGAALDELAQIKAELASLKGAGAVEVEKLRADIAAERKAQAEAVQAQARDASVKQLVGMVTEKAPAALAYYGDERGMVARAQAIATEYCEAKGVDICPFHVVVQELESEAKSGVSDRVKALEAQLAALKGLQQPAGISGTPTQPNGVRATGSRTLSSSTASERRATPKSPQEMTPDEQDAAMRAAAREAMGPTKKSRMAT